LDDPCKLRVSYLCGHSAEGLAPDILAVLIILEQGKHAGSQVSPNPGDSLESGRTVAGYLDLERAIRLLLEALEPMYIVVLPPCADSKLG
jgi:hypothetical protein